LRIVRAFHPFDDSHPPRLGVVVVLLPVLEVEGEVAEESISLLTLRPGNVRVDGSGLAQATTLETETREMPLGFEKVLTLHEA